MNKLAILASGSGTNTENIIRYFATSATVNIDMVMTDNPNAGVLDRASNLHVPAAVFTRQQFREGRDVVSFLEERGIEFIVLAGFLTLISQPILDRFTGRIINIHPALLPAYGGKGMYGDHVHRAVIDAGEKLSGITIHYVNEKYDDGAIIARFTVPVDRDDTPESLAEKIHRLEYEHYPREIEKLILG